MTSNIDPNLVVTVTVVTYNSAKYVWDTLESVKKQTYPYLSLIITDDCSTDKTVEVCKKWVSLNEARFVETQILESPINTGISANGNRGSAACKTKWVKGIAGDDLLLPNCIQDNVDYVKEHEDAYLIFSRLEAFGDKRQINHNYESQFDYSFFSESQQEQLDRLIFGGNCLPAPTLFCDLEYFRKMYISNDERIPMLEDWPKWINCLRKGVKFWYMDKTTVRYRVRGSSLSTSRIPSVKFFQSLRLFYYYYQRDEFVKRYGYDKTVELEMDLWTSIYSNYYLYRNLFSSKAYFFLTHIKQKILDSFGRKK